MTAEDVLARLRALVSDWEANGNSRPLGDPTASTWHQCARQLLTELDAGYLPTEERAAEREAVLAEVERRIQAMVWTETARDDLLHIVRALREGQ